MPRYFFHLCSTEKRLQDCEGLKLPGHDAARQEARQVAQDFWQPARGCVAPEWDGWSIEVRDERGRCVFRLPLAEAPLREQVSAPSGDRQQTESQVVHLDLERAKREFVAIENQSRELVRRVKTLADRNRYEAKNLYSLTQSLQENRRQVQELLARSRDQRASNEWDTAEKATG